MEQFFAHQQVGFERALEVETPAQRQARLSLKQSVSTHTYYPGWKSGKVFIWEKEEGFWIHKPITCGEVGGLLEQLWTQATSVQ